MWSCRMESKHTAVMVVLVEHYEATELTYTA